MTDGWKFAESLLGVAAEALKARREAEARAEASDDYVPGFGTREEAQKAMDDLSGVNSVARGRPVVVAQNIEFRQDGTIGVAEDPHEHHRRMWVLHGERKAPSSSEDVGPNSEHWRKVWAAEVAMRKAASGSDIRDVLRTGRLPQDEPENFRALREDVRILESERKHVRDAALEEAARAIRCFPDAERCAVKHCPACNDAERIRALKSKPAPDVTLDPSAGRELLPKHTIIRIVDGKTETKGVILYGDLPSGTIRYVCRMTNVQGTVYCIDKKHLPQSQPSGNSGELPTRCHLSVRATMGQKQLDLPCTLPARHEGGCEHDFLKARIAENEARMDQAGRAMEESAARAANEPLHDFGWALQQMRAGKKVRRVNESNLIAFTPDGFHFGGNEILLSKGDLLATDWQVVE